MKVLNFFSQYSTFTHGRPVLCSINRGALTELGHKRWFSTYREDTELNDFIEYIDALKNYEKMGVPKGAGTDSDDGFDLGRMRRLMDCLGNPQSKFKVVHIAGTKGKGSTASYLSNILRAEGYHVGCYTSPHVLSIRERMSLGRLGEPVSSKALNCLFHRIKQILDEAIVLEDGCLSHFEILTAVAFALFAQENVDIAVIEAGLGGARDATNIISGSELASSVITTIGEEHLAALGGSLESIAMAKAGIIKHGRPLILGGPFLPHIEDILRRIASSMGSPIISASNPGIRTVIKGVSMFKGRPYQSCDIMMKPYEDFQLFIELAGVNLCMLGSHQLQNAITAVCTALCLRNQGWTISDGSIRVGLEKTCLPGRGQFLTSKESEKLGLQGASVLLDGAHTKESAKALLQMIKMAFPGARLALVVAMASDKDHFGFAKEFLSGGQLEAVFLTEANIAGGKSRTTAAPFLRDCWLQASKELGIDLLHDRTAEYGELFKDKLVSSAMEFRGGLVLVAENSLAVSLDVANQILQERSANRTGILVVTGSLHIVSSVLGSLNT
ncbi:hypothetical protein SLEP1_g30050 [Rubroshorea leprosula]|uniref:Mur ligase central domain-containing protein n=1 Tax=Rubroshorea leprosula TaxID=152421 RepID=A0AAV5JYU3_9ROSI|nr:hypothetical protein SLEP1_g30050 [Rubroshorea leprosula]